MRQVLQSAMDLLQIATGITKCDDYYKLRQYTIQICILYKMTEILTSLVIVLINYSLRILEWWKESDIDND